ncbi:hypothetical protein K5X82_05095 [Halosquirtibacter xylanolyticus]|uniref:hypothetical protein n=1 Tax=Halosquirtibacter xylanolyticus TaxID=3374599 RepID=UPI003749EBE5|nr:hypothetical protein K5X82_05095 [Prolixibacteraceae bacterium]
MKQLFLLILLFSTLTSVIKAQTLEEFKKQQRQELNKFAKKEQQGIQSEQDKYLQYKMEASAAFTKYLEEEWKAFNTFKANPIPESVEPEQIPVAPKRQRKKRTIHREHVDKILTPLTTLKAHKEEVILTLPLSQGVDKEGMAISEIPTYRFSFYGADLQIQIPNEWRNVKIDAPFSSKMISNCYSKWSRLDIEAIKDQMEAFRFQYNLNDWAYYMLLSKVAATLFENQPNMTAMWTWFVLLNQEYDVRIAYDHKVVTLLIHTDVEAYRLPYMMLDNKRYYVTANKNGEWYTYNKQYDGAKNAINLTFSQPVNLNQDMVNREVNFKYNRKPYQFHFAYNKNLIDFYNDYPSIAVQEYFITPTTEQMQKEMDNQLKPILDNMDSEQEKLSFLLSFVQEGFPYKRDVEQFGKEKYFYVEDMFAYPYSDCEDRSVLLSYMVRHYMRMQTLGVWTPGHMFVAVGLDPSKGDIVYYNTKQYTVCDPTYLGAKVGQGMPDAMKSKMSLIPCP